MTRHASKLLIAILAITLFATLSSAREWTVMAYIGADNDLSSYVNGDMDEMESAGSTGDVAILVQIDGKASYGGYDDYLGTSWSTVRRYYIQAGNSTDDRINAGFISDLGELNSENPNVLRDFVIWGMDNYPANRYMVIIWNHGGGWARPGPVNSPFKAIVWDDTNGDGNGIQFANGEYRNMLRSIRDHLGRSINVMCFDACIVGLLETEYETMGYADYLVHSEANVPGNGYSYEFLQTLIANPTISEENLITEIVSRYSSDYTSAITLSGLRLDHDHVDFQMAINDFARQLILAGGKSVSAISSAITNARDFDDNLVDIYDFATKIDAANIGGAGSALDLAAQALKTALGYPPPVAGKPLVAAFQRSYTGASGVMAYTPTGTASSTWSSLELADCSIWKEFIGGSTSLPTTKLAYWGNTLGKYIETGSAVDLYVHCRNLGSGTASSVTATLSSIDTRVTIGASSVSFGNIAGGAIATSATPFVVTISPTVPESSFVPFEITFSTGKKQKFILTALGVVNYPPEQVVSTSPFNFARVITTTPSLYWSVPNDPDGDPLHFDVQWDTNPNFTAPVTISSNSSSIGFSPSVPRMTGDCNYLIGSQGEASLTNGATYWWRVRAKDDYSNGAWSEIRSLTINTALPAFDWHQTTNAQFDIDSYTGTKIEDDRVTIEQSSTVFADNMEYASESEAWTVWGAYDGGTNIEISIYDLRYVSPSYGLRVRDRNTSAYGGAWRSFEGITKGRAKAWAKIYDPSIGDKAEFLGLHNATSYTSVSTTTGILVYAKGDTLKYWDGVGTVIHLSMDSLWHYYEIEFDLVAGTSELFVDGVSAGVFGVNGLSSINLLGVGSKILGTAAQGTAYWDDFELVTAGTADSGVIVGKAVAFDWRPGDATSWGWANWTQNAGDSIKVTAQYRSGGAWADFGSRIATGSLGSMDIHGIGTADSVRLRAVLYFREGYSAPELFDWSVDWNNNPLEMFEAIDRPERLSIGYNFPNPFNAATTIEFTIPDDGIAEIAIFNIRGERVFEEASNRGAGLHTLRWDAGDLPSGTYFCRVKFAEELAERRLLLIK